ncbi:helix-turn-helix domain-containing protein [Streptomyces phaeochromogenes]|uniref:Helix-turn-helix transcriptional regulator n=1 Tax=Streptomyces phaeochromogenes TaxID=1923 RepID=A0ABZ1H3J5_STRPH|nr:helix-turn-helix domain-containing protein [Streptomyces phaeochromogenes]MCX5603100.1 helix-turn-helix transcriptional regulator [Streptomyces phaeochromogenes]WRZ27472.1 helix-turn-helix transcriptional regulator [Streptomyces phaeochromogenes]WSD13035.1 helix-turn-helix transcriptional regulator [Streptomyces phaeochromogenes]WSJ10170.1 helix-turn-helix transcriptional regulator [Streptomyces phaeochromogenes]WSW19501.1 helix-turn-helix transcriptional regulator [Streptomyces phaeochromo
MTTKAKPARKIEPGTYEAYMHDCPAVALLSTISNRWVSLTMCTLGANGDAMRYSHISREIPGVSQKMLTQTLRMLERDGMVERTVTPSVPVRVDYELTPLGQGLYDLLSQVRDWAADKTDDVDAARARYDTRQADQ